MPSSTLRVVSDVACTVCGCVCDDLRMTVDGDKITDVRGACHLSEPFFLNQHTRRPPVATIDGEAVTVDEAVVHAAHLICQSRNPLIYGLSRSSTEGQRAAVWLADIIGANIDTTASLCHAPSIMAIQEVGESTCSLGEIRNRADLVMFWGVDPVQSHPRHFERYSVEPVGEFVPNGRADRTVVVLDSGLNQSRSSADIFVPIPPGCDFDVLWSLRCLLRGVEPRLDSDIGLSLDALTDLTDRMKSCRWGVLFFGLGLARQSLGHRSVEALLRLTSELNSYTRFYARRMRIPGDVTGADSVLCWQTGFAFGVNLGRGFPRYNPGEYTANDMLKRREIDLCLLIGSESVQEMDADAREHLTQVPTIVLDHPMVEAPFLPTVHFTTAVYGIHAPGTAYRMDEIPVPLRRVLPTDYPTDDCVLNDLRKRLGQDIGA